MHNRQWKLAMGIGAAAVVAGGVAGIAGVATAEPSAKGLGYVDGFGKVSDDWNDHEREAGVLCDGCDNSSGNDLVVLWQSVLAADGQLTGDQIDGEFGPDTAEATAAWQEANGLEPSGEVDQATWAIADDKLEWADDGDVGYVDYVGEGDGRISFIRAGDDAGAYDLQSVTDTEGTELTNSTGEGFIEFQYLTITLG